MTQRRMIWSPLGDFVLVATETALVAADWVTDCSAPATGASGPHPVLDRAERELREYFAGQRRCFETPILPTGTAFERLVWKALQTIAYGSTRSYFGIARQIGRPRAARAVGAANAKNPLALFVPCHRVVGSDGALTGYAGGIERKRWLLLHESSVRPSSGVFAGSLSSGSAGRTLLRCT